MSEELFDVAEFWLPSDFVYDDLLLEDERRRKALMAAPPQAAAKALLSAGLVDGFASNPAVESDQKGCLAGLTQQMAHSFLLDGGMERNASAPPYAADKPRHRTVSPQSTLCSWPASKKGSMNGPSLACLPPLSKEEQQEFGEPWSVLSEAAAQVMQLKLRDLVHRRDLYERGLLGLQRKPTPAVPALDMNAGNAPGYYAGPLPTLQQLREAQFFRLKQLQLMKQQQQQHQQWGKKHRANGGGGYGEGRCGRSLDLSPPSWPPLQKQRQQAMATSGDGMRAVFLNSAKKQCAGTGVFIPRPAGGKVNEPPRKKTVSSTVLVPTRVVQALNLDLEELDAQARFSIDHAAPISRSNALPQQKPKPKLHAHTQKAVTPHDLRLPQEWIY